MPRSMLARVAPAIAATLSCTFLCIPVIGASEETPPAAARSSAAALDGVRVAGVDLRVRPESGRLVEPSAEELDRLRAALAALFSPTRTGDGPLTRTDGTLTLVLDERQAVFSVAEIDRDGRLATRCVTGADGAAAALDARRRAADAGEE